MLLGFQLCRDFGLSGFYQCWDFDAPGFWVVGLVICFKANCLTRDLGRPMGRVPSLGGGVFLRDPSLYLCKFERKP